MKHTAVIICTRLSSSRVPKKSIYPINGKPALEHLIKRIGLFDIHLAMPEEDLHSYDWQSLTKRYPNVYIHTGYSDDPLKRMAMVAEREGINSVIRITHDKIFVNEDDLYGAIAEFHKLNLDYLYSSEFTPGSGFEIISADALKRAADMYTKVEHISYAIKSITNNSYNYQPTTKHDKSLRLLIDYPEDTQLLETITSTLGNDVKLSKVIDFCNEHDWVRDINKLPPLTVYTCAYNASKWIADAMESVANQNIFSQIQYVIIDDHSTDRTPYLISQFAHKFPNVEWLRTTKNVGLASCSNIALSMARGEYVVRLDADDFFAKCESVSKLYDNIKSREVDAVYPNNYYGSFKVIQNGKEQHHVGGTIFKTAAINHIKFTEGLRGYEGLDFYVKAQKLLRIGYLNTPIFFYRQHKESMSKNNLEERAKLKEVILKDETN